MQRKGAGAMSVMQMRALGGEGTDGHWRAEKRRSGSVFCFSGAAFRLSRRNPDALRHSSASFQLAYESEVSKPWIVTNPWVRKERGACCRLRPFICSPFGYLARLWPFIRHHLVIWLGSMLHYIVRVEQAACSAAATVWHEALPGALPETACQVPYNQTNHKHIWGGSYR